MHVADLDAADHAGGGADAQRAARVVGVHVRLEGRRSADDEHAVAERRERAGQRVPVDRVALDEEARAVAVARRLGVHRVERDGGSELGIDRRRRRRLAADAGEQTAQELDEPGAAGVDDAGLAQSRQQLGRARERALALGEGGVERALRIAVSRRLGAARHLAG